MILITYSKTAKRRLRVSQGVCDWCGKRRFVTNVRRDFREQIYVSRVCAFCHLDGRMGGELTLARERGVRHFRATVNPERSEI